MVRTLEVLTLLVSILETVLLLLLLRGQAAITHAQKKLWERLHTMPDDVKAEIAVLVGKFNDATNAIAAEIEALKGQIANGSITNADVDSAFQPIIDKLNALGASPANPVP